MPSLAVPHLESDLLWEVAVAVARRGKAIRYHGSLDFSRAVEDYERLNLDYTSSLRFRVRLSIWSDGALWLGITKPGPSRTGGWGYCDEFHSRLGDLVAQDVAERFEQTIHSPTEARSFWPAISDETQST
jgi:hypothetical protein